MKYKHLLFIPAILFFLSCKKNDIGGKSTVNGVVKHHEKIIPGSRVFVKYNATEFPGSDTTKYDTKVVADAEGKFSIKFYKGDYFLYGFGFDPGEPGNVSGGIHVKLRNKEETEIVVPVTEH